MRIGIATRGSWSPARVPRSVCSARVRPSTTGSTASSWLGFAARVTVTSPVAVVRPPSAPRWYFTSPVPPSGSAATASPVRSPSHSRRTASPAGGERRPVAARLDRRPEPDPLLVVGDVLELVGDPPAVGLAQQRQGLGERLAADVGAEEPGGDARLELRRQRRDEPLRLERRV